jgi:hypothetical protein
MSSLVVHAAVQVTGYHNYHAHELIKPEYYVVDLLCGIRCWASQERWDSSRKDHSGPGQHFDLYKHYDVLEPGQLTRVWSEVTCMGCLVAVATSSVCTDRVV